MTLLRKTTLTLTLLVASVTATAAPIGLDGDHFSVTYDDALTGLFGAGGVSGAGNTVFFSPTAFTAVSGVAGGATSTASSLQLTFSADPGYALTGLDFLARGDYLLFGSGQVNTTARIAIANTGLVLDLAPAAPLDQVGAPTRNWELAGSLDLGGPQTLTLTLDSTLFAATPAAGLAFIETKFAGFGVRTTAIPEPASGRLLLAGLVAAALAFHMRRREPSPTFPV